MWFRGARKLYSTLYSCVVISLFNTGLCNSYLFSFLLSILHFKFSCNLYRFYKICVIIVHLVTICDFVFTSLKTYFQGGLGFLKKIFLERDIKTVTKKDNMRNVLKITALFWNLNNSIVDISFLEIAWNKDFLRYNYFKECNNIALEKNFRVAINFYI